MFILPLITGACSFDLDRSSSMADQYERALSTWKSDSQNSLQILEGLIEQSSGSDLWTTKAYLLQYYIFARQGLQEEEYKALIKAKSNLEVLPNHEVATETFNALSYFYYSRGFWAKAEHFGWKALEAVELSSDKSKYNFVLFNLGGALFHQDKWNESLEIIEKVSLSDNVGSRINQLEWLAAINLHLEKYDEAIANGKECLDLIGTEDDPKAFYILNTLGLVYNNLGDLDQSAAFFEKSYRVNNSFHYAIFNAGKLFEELGEYEKSVQYYEVLRNWDISSELNIDILTTIHKGLNRLQLIYHLKGEQNKALQVMLEAENLLERKTLTEAAQKELEAVYALDELEDEALNDIIQQTEAKANTNRKMAILFAGLLAMVLIAFFAWAMSLNRRKYSVANSELAADARDVIDFLSLQVTQIDLEPKVRQHSDS